MGLCGVPISALLLWRPLTIPDREIPKGHLLHRETSTDGETEAYSRKMPWPWSQSKNMAEVGPTSGVLPCPCPDTTRFPALQPISPLTAPWLDPLPGPCREPISGYDSYGDFRSREDVSVRVFQRNRTDKISIYKYVYICELTGTVMETGKSNIRRVGWQAGEPRSMPVLQLRSNGGLLQNSLLLGEVSLLF